MLAYAAAGALLVVAALVVVVKALPGGELPEARGLPFLAPALLFEASGIALACVSSIAGLAGILALSVLASEPSLAPAGMLNGMRAEAAGASAAAIFGTYLAGCLVFFTNAVVLASLIERRRGGEGGILSSLRGAAPLVPGIALASSLALTASLACFASRPFFGRDPRSNLVALRLARLLSVDVRFIECGLWLTANAAIAVMLLEGRGPLSAFKRLSALQRPDDQGAFLSFARQQAVRDATVLMSAAILFVLGFGAAVFLLATRSQESDSTRLLAVGGAGMILPPLLAVCLHFVADQLDSLASMSRRVLARADASPARLEPSPD